MEKNTADKTDQFVKNILKIISDNNLTQAEMAEYAGTSDSQFSKILKGKSRLSLVHISNIARNMNMNVVDIITYPEIYVKKEQLENKEQNIKATLQIELSKEKKDQVLRLVLGKDSLDILS